MFKKHIILFIVFAYFGSYVSANIPTKADLPSVPIQKKLNEIVGQETKKIESDVAEVVEGKMSKEINDKVAKGLNDEFVTGLTNKVDNVENAIVAALKNDAEIVEELLKANNDITEGAKKFWAQHEMNVTQYLGEIYGSTKVGQQITVDVYIQGRTTPLRCRIDNLIDVGGGKFRIADSKSSIVNNLSQNTAEQLRNNMSTTNQKTFYDALKDGTVTQIKPVGDRAIDFFTLGGRKGIPVNGIQVEKSIDFFVNDLHTNGYNIYKKTLVQ